MIAEAVFDRIKNIIAGDKRLASLVDQVAPSGESLNRMAPRCEIEVAVTGNESTFGVDVFPCRLVFDLVVRGPRRWADRAMRAIVRLLNNKRFEGGDVQLEGLLVQEVSPVVRLDEASYLYNCRAVLTCLAQPMTGGVAV